MRKIFRFLRFEDCKSSSGSLKFRSEWQVKKRAGIGSFERAVLLVSEELKLNLENSIKQCSK